MSDKTNISYVDSTASNVLGCDQTSPGCLNCWAKQSTPARVLRHRGIETWGPQGVRHTLKGFEKSMLALNRKPWICDQTGSAFREDELSAYLQGANASTFHRRRVFLNSLSDWLDPRWSSAQLAHLLGVIHRCPDIIHILCTKRPENWRGRVFEAQQQCYTNVHEKVCGFNDKSPMTHWERTAEWLDLWLTDTTPPANIIILASVENQETADRRIPELLKIPAACRGLSIEPMLGPIRIRLVNKPAAGGQIMPGPLGIGWIIVGGESGHVHGDACFRMRPGGTSFVDDEQLRQPQCNKHEARPCNVEWIRNIVGQCKAANVPCFVKQLGSNPWMRQDDGRGPELTPLKLKHPSGADPSEWPTDLQVQQFPQI